nr:hypothetical protein [Tanacetum cinerariifolium]
MREPTIEEYITITRLNYDLGNEKGRIELKGRFLLELQNNDFNGTNGEDTIEHIESFLEIVYSLNITNKRGDDKEVKIENELSNPKDDDSIKENEIAQISKINIDIFRFKPLYEYKDDWIYEWNNGIPWVDEKPWTNDEDGYCNTRDLPGFIRDGNSIRYEDYEWYDTNEDSELKEEALINKRVLEKPMNVMKESSDDKWDHDSPVDK